MSVGAARTAKGAPNARNIRAALNSVNPRTPPLLGNLPLIQRLKTRSGELPQPLKAARLRGSRESGGGMLRDAFSERLKQAMRAKDTRTLSTVRLILAGLKERDVEARGSGNQDGIPEPEILRLLQGMVKQRRESIALYRQGNRSELAQQEEEEIAIIESFLPKQMNEEEIAAAAKKAIAEPDAAGSKDTGKVMGLLRERHAGVLDMARAGAVVKQLLG